MSNLHEIIDPSSLFQSLFDSYNGEVYVGGLVYATESEGFTDEQIAYFIDALLKNPQQIEGYDQTRNVWVQLRNQIEDYEHATPPAKARWTRALDANFVGRLQALRNSITTDPKSTKSELKELIKLAPTRNWTADELLEALKLISSSNLDPEAAKSLDATLLRSAYKQSEKAKATYFLQRNFKSEPLHVVGTELTHFVKTNALTHEEALDVLVQYVQNHRELGGLMNDTALTSALFRELETYPNLFDEEFRNELKQKLSESSPTDS